MFSVNTLYHSDKWQGRQQKFNRGLQTMAECFAVNSSLQNLKQLKFLWRWRHYCDVTWHVYIEHSQSVQYSAHSYNLPSVTHHCELQILNAFSSNVTCLNDNQNPRFIFQHVVQIYLNTYPIYKQVPECLMQKKQCWLLSQLLVNSWLHLHANFCPRSKLLTQNMYCWSCKILFTIYWTHLRVNGIWTVFFWDDATMTLL